MLFRSPAIFVGENLFVGEGLILLVGVCITIAGIAVIGFAGSLRSKNMSKEENMSAIKDFALTKGLFVALLAGVMSACFALGLSAGAPIKEFAILQGVNPLYAGLPVIFLVTLGGSLTNVGYCVYQNVKSKDEKTYFISTKQFINNILLCALSGVLWYSQFFGLEIGKSLLIDSPLLLALSWSILMSLNVIFSNFWGVVLKEWKGCNLATVIILIIGITILVFSLFYPLIV